MTSEILIGLGGLLLSVLTYFAGVQGTQKRPSKKERNTRIQKVLDKYMGFRRSNYTSGIDGLQKAGAATLMSDDEVRELIDLIIKHGDANPLGNKAHLFDTIDFKRFFDYVANNRIDFFDTRVEDVLEKSRSKAYTTACT